MRTTTIWTLAAMLAAATAQAGPPAVPPMPSPPKPPYEAPGLDAALPVLTCMPVAQAHAQMRARGEALFGYGPSAGGHQYVMGLNPQTGAWSLTAYRADNCAVPLAAGPRWTMMPPPPPGQRL